MDNKLSELSKPVAWKLHHHDRYYFEENADVVAIAESMGQAKGDAVYSQEYVSALQHESAVNWEAAASLNVENQELKKRIAELDFLRLSACEVFKEIGNELGCNPDNESIMMAIDELKKRLATPVRLPNKNDAEFWFDGVFQIAKFDRAVERAISAAGLEFVGDE
ncbi:TPA: hypothetical protein I9738_001037 [Serratia marcescens]|uniref:hypothetical protein n=1 Tax=Serratia sp. CY29653 TaxID=3383594 RepID=UPI001A2B498E|nr:hypothetical protein [Serratia marcescens]HAT4973117.1 hypothetical protein [Serratia marcescens]HAT4987311.1 hypothetical protein [Serratia marcescens]HAT5047121.1 hypothetical protein [Serratia marcescens]HEJ7078215.1 hypothetical protein [Serratia marcescens]